MNRIAFLPFAFTAVIPLSLPLLAGAQAVLEPVTRTIQCEKAEVLFLTIAPKGDRILVGTTKGADVMDLVSGKRVFHLDFMEDNSTAVYYAMFNDNGEYAMLAGFTGKREIWDMKNGTKEGGNLANFRWMPNSLAMKALNLKVGNSPFDRFYQQEHAEHGDITAKADKNGAVVFTGKDGAAVQTLLFPENKDQQHRSPCLFHGTEFITGTDNGKVLFYTLR
jgi:hypothetical protein